MNLQDSRLEQALFSKNNTVEFSIFSCIIVIYVFYFYVVMDWSLLEKIRDQEVKLKYSRSWWPWGQHVNKTETKVQLFWDTEKTTLFPSEQVEQLKLRYAKYLTKDLVLTLEDSSSRQRSKNIENVRKRFSDILLACFEIPKERAFRTKVPKSQKEKRYKEKKRRSETKKNRSRDYRLE